MKILGIVVARRGSERLPGKVLRDLVGKPMLLEVLARAGRAKRLSGLVVALPDNKNDDAIEAVCTSNGIYCFRGAEYDLLDRVYRTAIAYGAEIVVPLRSHCPLIDPDLIDEAVKRLLDDPAADWCTNRFPLPTFPQGLEVDAIRIETLRVAWQEDSHPGSRQHVEGYLLRRPEQFTTATFACETNLADAPWSVATLQDLDRVRTIFEKFNGSAFTWREALDVWQSMPRDSQPTESGTHQYWYQSEA